MIRSMGSPVLPPPSGDLAPSLLGMWRLLSREDWTPTGERRVEPTLGSDPVALVAYSNSHFAAQFMKRDRATAPLLEQTKDLQNNTTAVGGYDAYFGTYVVNEATGLVAHTLIAALSAGNIGKTFDRAIRVEGDRMTLQLETTTQEGEPITRTLVWERLN